MEVVSLPSSLDAAVSLSTLDAAVMLSTLDEDLSTAATSSIVFSRIINYKVFWIDPKFISWFSRPDSKLCQNLYKKSQKFYFFTGRRFLAFEKREVVF